MRIFMVVALIWILCWVFTAGAGARYFACEFPEQNFREHLGSSAAMGLMGPFSIPASVFLTGFLRYGWGLTKPSPEACAAGK